MLFKKQIIGCIAFVLCLSLPMSSFAGMIVPPSERNKPVASSQPVAVKPVTPTKVTPKVIPTKIVDYKKLYTTSSDQLTKTIKERDALKIQITKLNATMKTLKESSISKDQLDKLTTDIKNLQSEVTKKQSEIDRNASQFAEYQSAYSTLSMNYQNTLSDNTTMKKTNEDLSSQVNTLTTQVSDATDKITTLTQITDATKKAASIVSAQEYFRRMVNLAYQSVPNARTKLLRLIAIRSQIMDGDTTITLDKLKKDAGAFSTSYEGKFKQQLTTLLTQNKTIIDAQFGGVDVIANMISNVKFYDLIMYPNTNSIFLWY